MINLRVFEAFAGYGSQSIALDELCKEESGLNFQVVGLAEIDKWAIKAYRANHGNDAPNFGDITKIDWSQVPDFNFLTYSFPCQDISSAGLQRGFSQGSGTRSSCLWACADAIRAKLPKYLLMENVKALLQKKFASDFLEWREWLKSQGYKNYYTVLNAKDYGVPQNRERVFMVSVREEHPIFTSPKPIILERRLKHVLEECVDERYWLKPEQIEAIIKHNERKQSEGCGFKTNFQTGEGIAGAIKTKEGSREYDTYIKVPTYGNSRLTEMIRNGKIDPTKTLWIDCYNQRVDPDIAGTILARVNATGHYLISDPRGYAMRGRPDASGRNSQQIELGSDVANALTSVQKDSMVAEARVIQVGNLIEDSAYKNPHRGRVYSVEGIAPCLNCNEGGQREVKIIMPNTDRVIQVGNIREKEGGFDNPQRGRIYSPEGVAPTLMSNNQGGGREVKIIQRGHGYAKGGVFDICPALTTSKWQDNHFALIEYWIRKLTPRECFRLMDVPEHIIDIMLSAGISNSQCYKLAGNSIVVAVLKAIFRKMFIDHSIGIPQFEQPTLF